jgi:hypothetical protein
MLGCIGALGVGLAVVAASLPPPTIEVAVAAVHEAAGGPSDDVHVTNGRCVPTNELCRNYIADVVMRAEQGPGRLICASPWEARRLTMEEYGLREAPVPRVAKPNPWLAPILMQAQRIEAWLRRTWSWQIDTSGG